MSPLQWFLVGGIWMWPILLLVLVGSAISLATLVVLGSHPGKHSAVRKGLGITLVVVAVLCIAAGVAGYSYSKLRMNAFVQERNITNPEFFAVANREARVPLEASIIPGLLFAGIGILAVTRKAKQ
jgi:hypothetical protein